MLQVDKNVFIFDLDGTLYSMKKMHRVMALRLLLYYGLRPWKIKELWTIRKFRIFRYRDKYTEVTTELVCEAIAKEMGITAQRVQDVIYKWMFMEPLKVISGVAYIDVLKFLQMAHEEGCKIIIYSDYPAEDKLKAMGVKADLVFVPFVSDGIKEVKPSRKSMEYIMGNITVHPNKVLYVGDRDDKDGVSAEFAQIDYMDINKFRATYLGVKFK